MAKFCKWFLAIVFVYVPAAFVLGSVILVLLMKSGPITTTPMMILREWNGAAGTGTQWTSLDGISDEMKTAVILSEDANFYEHDGFDFYEIGRMCKAMEEDGAALRGCSTISQQTAKNCFTFGSRTWFRKAVEAWFTVLIEKFWGKDRILEVYMNVAEMGPGLYGVEAASEKYFGIPASKLTAADASSLACCLPAPSYRTPNWVNIHMSARRSRLATRTKCGR